MFVFKIVDMRESAELAAPAETIHVSSCVHVPVFRENDFSCKGDRDSHRFGLNVLHFCACMLAHCRQNRMHRCDNADLQNGDYLPSAPSNGHTLAKVINLFVRNNCGEF